MNDVGFRSWIIVSIPGFNITIWQCSRIIYAEIEKAINTVNAFNFVISSADLLDFKTALGSNELTNSTFDVSLYYEVNGDSPRITGNVYAVEFIPIGDDFQARFLCNTHANELQISPLHFGKFAIDENSDDVATRLLTYPTGLVNTWTNSGFTGKVTRQFSNMSRWRGLQEIANLNGGFIRESIDVDDEIEMITTPASSGITLVQQGEGNVAPLVSEGYIKQLKYSNEDARQMVNRIYPLGGDKKSTKVRMDKPFDLQAARTVRTEALGYISDVIETWDDNVEVLGYADSGLINNKTETTLVSITVGDSPNTCLIAFAHYEGTDSFSPYHQLLCNGEPMSAPASNNAQGRIIGLFFHPVEPGTYNITGIVNSGATVDTRITVVALANVYVNGINIGMNAFSKITTASGSSTTPTSSGDITGSDIDDTSTPHHAITMSFVARGSAVTINSNSHNEIFNSSGSPARVTVGYSDAGDTSNQLAMVYSVSSQWNLFHVAIRPYKKMYIEDAVSIVNYGLKEATLIEPAITQQGTTDAERRASAATLYDFAASKLVVGSVPIKLRQFEIGALGSVDFNVGDTMRIIYADKKEQINEEQIILHYKEIIKPDGRIFQMDMVNVAAFPQSDNEYLINKFKQLNDQAARLS